MGKYNETSKKYTAEYVKENYDEIKLRVPKGEKDEIKKAAAAANETVNGYIKTAIDSRLESGT